MVSAPNSSRSSPVSLGVVSATVTSNLHTNLPILLAGGRLQGGRHIRVEEETPLTNLQLSMLDKIGVATERLGDSSGQLTHLSDV